MKGFVKLETNQVPQSGVYLFSNIDGFTRLNDSDKTQSMMMMMKHRDDPKKGKIVYADGAQALVPTKKTLDLSKAREAVNQSSPLIKSYAKKYIDNYFGICLLLVINIFFFFMYA